MGPFSIWLVLSLLAVPLIIGGAVYLIRRVRAPAPQMNPIAQTISLRELRDTLRAGNPDAYKMHLESVFDHLQAKHGNDLPLAEVVGIQQKINLELASFETRRRDIIDRAAEQGKTIAIESLRKKLEAREPSHIGLSPDEYAAESQRLIDSLTKKYGSHIPVDHAYKIIKCLEAGLGLPAEDDSA